MVIPTLFTSSFFLPRPAALLSPRTTREPILGLPGAALDGCNVDLRITLYRWCRWGRGSLCPEGWRHSADRVLRATTPEGVSPIIDLSRCPYQHEFNCFLRSRCSLEMRCPDDIVRDSWDWVGPPAWRRACFNSPEWGGGSSPVKTEPLQIVLLLLLL